MGGENQWLHTYMTRPIYMTAYEDLINGPQRPYWSLYVTYVLCPRNERRYHHPQSIWKGNAGSLVSVLNCFHCAVFFMVPCCRLKVKWSRVELAVSEYQACEDQGTVSLDVLRKGNMAESSYITIKVSDLFQTV